MKVVITGGSRGIGKAIALKFAAHGHDLFLCSRTIEHLEATRNEIVKQYPTISVDIFAADLSIKENVSAFASAVLSKSLVDILVNNSGTYQPGNVSTDDEMGLQNMMDQNFYSSFYTTRSFLPHLIQKKSGHIFNLCSIASLQAYEGGGFYGVSKYALLGFTRNLRHELKSHGIKVTAVFPGAVMTDSWAGFDNSENRIMVASDIADMIYASSMLSAQAVVEDIIIRPQLGDL
jgi:short-subunit dehydrogenase